MGCLTRQVSLSEDADWQCWEDPGGHGILGNVPLPPKNITCLLYLVFRDPGVPF